MDELSNYNRGRRGRSLDGFLPANSAQAGGRLTDGRPRDGFSANPLYKNDGPPAVATTPLGQPSPPQYPPQPISQKIRLGASQQSRRWPRLILRTAGLVLVAGVLMAGYIFGKGYLKARQIFKGGGGAAALSENVDPARLRGEGDGRVNILLLGRAGDGYDGPDLTDTIMVASISPAQKEAALLSVPRDFYIKYSGSYTKINAVYSLGRDRELAQLPSRDADRNQKAEQAGLKAAENSVSSLLGIPIHYRVMVDFAAFREAIDTVGGLEMNVPPELAVKEQMRIDGRPYYLNVAAGQQKFDGFRALAFARSRYTSPRGDFDRAERQRLLLVALKGKVLSAGTYGNPFKISQLIDAFGKHVQSNLSTDEVLRIYDIAKQTDSNNIASVGLADGSGGLVTTAFMNGQSVVIPRAGLGNYKELQSFVRNRLKDGFLASENASIAILNGTDTSGLASRTADDLKSYGYNVSRIGDAPSKGYGQTLIIDLRAGAKKYTRHYLENRFSVNASSSLPPGIDAAGADFVIILGQNESSRLGN